MTSDLNCEIEALRQRLDGLGSIRWIVSRRT